MSKIDWNYICTMMGDLAGIPVRIYQGKKQIFYHSLLPFSKDPIAECEDEILNLKKHVSYYVTDLFYYYGVVVSGEMRIVIGPATEGHVTDARLKELAFHLDVSAEEIPAFVQSMKVLVSFPLDSLIEMLLGINYLANGEKLHLQDINIQASDQKTIRKYVESEKLRIKENREDHSLKSERSTAGDQNKKKPVHNTYGIENQLLSMVRRGDTAAFQKWASQAPAVRAGEMATEQLRQLKNTFIVTATLVSRAAIQGGMDVDDAFAMSDLYIKNSEILSTPAAITNLSYRMMLDFTNQVNRIRRGTNGSELAVQVSNYVQHHLTDKIKTEDIADALYTSRTRLSANFHKETGETLSRFITEEKIEEAKRLLIYTTKTITAISEYLAFSSPAHFTSTFRTIAGMSPKEYRLKHQ